jgi:hypothetical protein
MSRNIFAWFTPVLFLTLAAGCSSHAHTLELDDAESPDGGVPDSSGLVADDVRPFEALQVGRWESLGVLDELAPSFAGAFEVRPAGNLVYDPHREEQLFFGGYFAAPDQLGGGRRSNALYGFAATEVVPLRLVHLTQSYKNPDYDVFESTRPYLEPSPRATGAGLAVTEDAIFVLGGECFGSVCPPVDFWRYEIASSKWAPLAPPTTTTDPRFALASIPDSGELWAFARPGDLESPRFIPFDLESRRWSNGLVAGPRGETIVHVAADPIRKDFVLLTALADGRARVHTFDPRTREVIAIEDAPAALPSNAAIAYEAEHDVLFFYSPLEGNVTVWDRPSDTWRRIVSRGERYARTDWRVSYDGSLGAVVALDSRGELRRFVWDR